MRRVLLIGLLGLLMPGGASAATLGQNEDGDFVYTAAPGEINVPAISYDRSARTLTITDPGATITATASAPCTVTGGVATCRTGRFARLDVALGDGDDTLMFEDPSDDPGDEVLEDVDAGPGADIAEVFAYALSGGDGDDRLVNDLGKVTGGAGDDELTGSSSFSSGADLAGGAGNDVLRGTGDSQTLAGGPGADTIDAGTRVGQTVSFAEATTPVIADVGVDGLMGPAGEQDSVSGVDGVIGGRGDDLLTGDARSNELSGGGGDDTLVGGHGDDQLSAGPGTDRVDGGGGSDVIADGGGEVTPDGVLDGGPDGDVIKSRDSGAAVLGGGGGDELFVGPRTARVEGGSGKDVLVSRKDLAAGEGISCGDDSDVIEGFGLAVAPVNCERIGFRHPKVSARIPSTATLTRNSLTFPVPNLCSATCVIEAEARSGKRVLPTGRARLRSKDGVVELTIVLAGRARRAVRRSGELTLVYDTSGQGHLSEATVTLRVKS